MCSNHTGRVTKKPRTGAGFSVDRLAGIRDSELLPAVTLCDLLAITRDSLDPSHLLRLLVATCDLLSHVGKARRF